MRPMQKVNVQYPILDWLRTKTTPKTVFKELRQPDSCRTTATLPILEPIGTRAKILEYLLDS